MSRIFFQSLRSKFFQNVFKKYNFPKPRKVLPISIFGIALGIYYKINQNSSLLNYSCPIVYASSKSNLSNPEDIVQMTLDGLLKVETCYGSTTGFLMDSSGFIVTHPLIIQNETSAKVTFQDKTTAEATIIAIDESLGLALLKANSIAKEAKPLQLELERKNIHVGEEILSVGYAASKLPSVTQGIISGIRQGVGFPLDPEFLYIQTDAPCHDTSLENKLSCSGFIMVNYDGKVVAVNLLKYKDFFFGLSSEHVNDFYNCVKNNLSKLKSQSREKFMMLRNAGALYPTCRYHGLLGVTLNESIKDALVNVDSDIPAVEGVYVLSVIDGSRAQQDGFLPGDIIIGVNQQIITNFESLSKLIEENDTMKLRVIRKAREGVYSKPIAIQVDFS